MHATKKENMGAFPDRAAVGSDDSPSSTSWEWYHIQRHWAMHIDKGRIPKLVQTAVETRTNQGPGPDGACWIHPDIDRTRDPPRVTCVVLYRSAELGKLHHYRVYIAVQRFTATDTMTYRVHEVAQQVNVRARVVDIIRTRLAPSANVATSSSSNNAGSRRLRVVADPPSDEQRGTPAPDDHMCQYCFENRARVLFRPCFHRYSCIPCTRMLVDSAASSQKKMTCPICQNPVDHADYLDTKAMRGDDAFDEEYKNARPCEGCRIVKALVVCMNCCSQRLCESCADSKPCPGCEPGQFTCSSRGLYGHRMPSRSEKSLKDRDCVRDDKIARAESRAAAQKLQEEPPNKKPRPPSNQHEPIFVNTDDEDDSDDDDRGSKRVLRPRKPPPSRKKG